MTSVFGGKLNAKQMPALKQAHNQKREQMNDICCYRTLSAAQCACCTQQFVLFPSNLIKMGDGCQ